MSVDDIDPVLPGADALVHCAALHAPHVGVASGADFVRVNVTGTERIVKAAQSAGVPRLVLISSTSVYGHALVDPDRAVWVDEELTPEPRDIYDTTKLEAEDIVAAAHSGALSTATLRLGRCFPEDWRLVVLNRLYRGLDIRDAVAGIVAAATTAECNEHHLLNLSGPRVFQPDDAAPLRADAPEVLRRVVPEVVAEFARRHWALPESIDRIHVSDRAQRVLAWTPTNGVQSALADPPGVDT